MVHVHFEAQTSTCNGCNHQFDDGVCSYKESPDIIESLLSHDHLLTIDVVSHHDSLVRDSCENVSALDSICYNLRDSLFKSLYVLNLQMVGNITKVKVVLKQRKKLPTTRSQQQLECSKARRRNQSSSRVYVRLKLQRPPDFRF